MCNIILFLILVLLSARFGFSFNYCEICQNHTLCKYTVPGPSDKCENYDYEARLSNDDIVSIVNKLNDRRHFVSSGHLKHPHLPSAANMIKIEWSNDLAVSAQRWADQCDGNFRPDKNDECRDQVAMKVGQNIATVVGPTPGMAVRNFVETWFMESLHYNGTVTYYNQSNDKWTRHFTQLIWAETRFVGCGRAKFTTYNRGVVIDRLICNFGPSGNEHGRPVYSVGIPGTQCKRGFEPDNYYNGLCTAMKTYAYTRHQTPGSPANTKSTFKSLLRIRNFDDAENSIENEQNLNKSKEKNPKIRHVFYSANDESLMQRDRPERISLRKHIVHENVNKVNKCTYCPHSRIIDYCTRIMYDNYPPEFATHACSRTTARHTKTITNPEEYSTENTDNRKTTEFITEKPNIDIKTAQYVEITTMFPTEINILTKKRLPLTLNTEGQTQRACSCSKLVYTTQSPKTTKRCTCDTDCNCLIEPRKLFNPQPPDKLRQAIRPFSPEYTSYGDFFAKNDEHTDSDNDDFLEKRNIHRKFPLIHYIDKRNPKEQLSRQPFWQMDGYHSNPSVQLRSLRYTTLGRKRKLKIKENFTTKIVTGTEPITIQPKKNPKNNNKHALREKYLSFDDLIDLRRNNEEDINTDTTPSNDQSMPSYPPTVPYSKAKACTRKLTCTWTTPTFPGGNGANDRHGNGYRPNGPGGGGSRTPPGYVEGCTRTSTCTRDHYERNKQASDIIPDEDYCERKSLNRKRSHNDFDVDTINENVSAKNENIDEQKEGKPVARGGRCNCDKLKRQKRQESNYEIYDDIENDHTKYDVVSYGDLFYSVVDKVIKKITGLSKSNYLSYCNNSNQIVTSCKEIILCAYVCNLIFIYIF